MPVSRLVINQLRNIGKLELLPSSDVNLIVGPNGSGKTSLLEAIYLLGRARSFKTRNPRAFIKQGEGEVTIFGEIKTFESATAINAGVTKTSDGQQLIKVAGNVANSAAALLELLPLQVIEPDTFKILSGGPSERRQFIDWGVFHVEHAFYPLWQQLNRCLKQRNKLLRRGKIDHSVLSVWNKEFVDKSESLGRLRAVYIEQLTPVFDSLMKRLCDIESIELEYYQGWKAKQNLADVLEVQVESDSRRGFTQSGPQRADLKVKYLGHSAGEVLSRGQQKLVICALKIAQGYLFTKTTGRPCVYLLDDLAAELDAEHCEMLCELLSTLDCQLFVTSVEKDAFTNNWSGRDVKVFHVKQGELSSTTGH